MRWLFAVCLLAACAGSPRPTAPAQRVEVRGEAWTISYRLVLDDPAAPRIEGIARITNRTAEDWTAAKLTLATAANGTDRDGDGIRDSADLCPGDPEDDDGYHDDDGCPERDNDSDRILDDTDKCPNDSEVYNGYEDEDGCPDRGTIVMTPHSGGIIEWVYFPSGSDVVKPIAFPLVDAVAATINGNPELHVIEVSGHADRTETDPWGLALRRAAAVSRRLIDQGVAPDRLTVGPYAATQPLAPGTSADALARNRRVGFVVVSREDEAAPPPPLEVRPPFDPPPPELVDDLRYDLAQPITARRGASVTLEILDKPVTAREVLVWQPAEDITHSREQPFRAVRLVNTSGFVLQRGPIEILGRGGVIARGVLKRTAIGETVWILGELDRTTTTPVSSESAHRPLRVAGAERGELVVEDAETARTMFQLEPAASAVPVYFHLRKLPGYSAHTLPFGTLELGDRYVVPYEGKLVALVEERVRRLRRPIATMFWRDLETYLDGSTLPPDVTEKLRAAQAVLSELASLRSDDQASRAKLNQAADRWTASRKPLDPVTRAQLEDAARAIGRTAALLESARTRLDDLIAKLPTW